MMARGVDQLPRGSPHECGRGIEYSRQWVLDRLKRYALESATGGVAIATP